LSTLRSGEEPISHADSCILSAVATGANMPVRATNLCAFMIGVIGSVAVTGWPTPSRAEQPPIVRSARVYIGDLHPDRAADAPILYARIRIAAQATCGDRQLPESHFTDPDFRRCVEVAIQEAIARVDSAALNAYYRQHTTRERRG